MKLSNATPLRLLGLKPATLLTLCLLLATTNIWTASYILQISAHGLGIS